MTRQAEIGRSACMLAHSDMAVPRVVLRGWRAKGIRKVQRRVSVRC
jgi:hypothetical protein